MCACHARASTWLKKHGMIETFSYRLTSMPILPREPDVYPFDLLDGPAPASSLSAQWWGLYTLSRREKELMRRLHHEQIPFYAPLIQRRRRSPSGRVRRSYVPLFSSYVFLFGDEEQRVSALQTNCVSNVLPIHDAVRLVNDLRQIRKLIESEAPLSPEARLETGERVRIRSGPLTGIEGVVIQRRGQSRLLVAVEFLQQGASVLLEDYLFEPVG